MQTKMKLYSYALALVVSVVAGACSLDENYYIKDVETNERSILAVKVGDQIGPHVITRTDFESKVTVYVKPATDLSAVAPDIQVSHKATVTPSPAEPFDFAGNNNRRVYTVTSETGLTRDWVVEVLEYDFDMGGDWKVVGAEFFFNVSEEYGASDWMGTKLLEWPLPGVADAKDDVITFTLEGVTPEGNLYGTFNHTPGPDGKYPNYNYAGNTPTNFDYKFAKLPEGTGTWVRNLTDNTLTFNDGESNESVSLPLEWSDDKSTLVIPFYPGPKDIVWDNDWNRMELQCTKEFWFTLVKE